MWPQSGPRSSAKSARSWRRKNLGGVCLNWGCIPTKSLLRNAEVISHLFEGETFGFALDTSSIKPDYAKAQQRSREVSARLVRGIGYLMKKNGVDVFADEGVFTGPKTLRLTKSGEELSADRVIIAAGARPNRLRGIDFSDEHILDSQKALQLTKAPRSALVIGAGAIGMEFATVWHAYGAEVTIAEMLPAALPQRGQGHLGRSAQALREAGHPHRYRREGDRRQGVL